MKAAQSEQERLRDEERVRRVELLISNLLRSGVIASLALVLFGTTLSFVHHPAYVSSPEALHHLTQPGAAFPHSLTGLRSGLQQLRGQSIVLLGLLLLIATPVMRVANVSPTRPESQAAT